MTERFAVSNLIRSILARGEEGVDPETVAKAVQRDIPPALYGEALAQLLPEAVRVIMNDIRGDGLIVRAAPTRSGDTSPAHARPAAKPHRAYNQQARVAYWQRYLQIGINVNGAKKAFGQLTREDLQWLRDDRYKDAAELTAKAEEFQYFNDLLAEYDVETVADLPEHVLDATIQNRPRNAGGRAA